MHIVESVEQLAKCRLSGLHATSDIATKMNVNKKPTYFLDDPCIA